MPEDSGKLNQEYGGELKDWPRKLWKSAGSPIMLSGVVIYHDFDPLSKHMKRKKCPGGQPFTKAVLQDSGDKRAALLLTEIEEEHPLVLATDDEHVVVVKVTELASLYQPLTIAAYVAAKTKVSTKSIEQMAHIDTDIVEALSDPNLPVAVTAPRLRTKPRSYSNLLKLFLEVGGVGIKKDGEAWKEALRALKDTDPTKLRNFFSILGELDGQTRRDLLNSLMKSVDGITEASHVLAEKTADRLRAVKDQCKEFREILETPGSTETDCQNYLTKHPWMFGLEYVTVRPKGYAVQGETDYLLERSDGFHDLLELKSPDDPVVDIKETKSKLAPSPTNYSLSDELANAIAQAHRYRWQLTEWEDPVAKVGRIENSRSPNIFIVIGIKSTLSEPASSVIEELNRTMHRVQIIHYDEIALRAETIVKNVEAYLVDRENPVAEEGRIGQNLVPSSSEIFESILESTEPTNNGL